MDEEEQQYRWRDLRYSDRSHWPYTLAAWAACVILALVLAWLAHRKLP